MGLALAVGLLLAGPGPAEAATKKTAKSAGKEKKKQKRQAKGATEPAVRHGFFIGGGLGLGRGNFSLEGGEDDVWIGPSLNLGYAWENGFAVGGGLSGTYFSYEVTTPRGERLDLSLRLFSADFSAFYFLPINEGFELCGRAGLNLTGAAITLEREPLNERDSVGVHVGVGGNAFFGGPVGLMFELTYRTYGVAFAETQGKEVSTFGLTVGLRYR